MKQLSNQTIKYFSKTFFLIFTFYLLLFTFSLPIKAAPATASGGLTSDINTALGTGTPFKYKEIGDLVSKGLELGLIIASLAVFIYLLWGGVEWITSGGDKNKLESAKGRITNAILGITIVASIIAVFIIINTFLGLPIKITGLTGGGGSGGTKPAWTCTGAMCDCCNATNKPQCCFAVGKYAARCVVGRYRNSNAECAQISIDWNNCFKEEYERLKSEGTLKEIENACK